MKFKVCPRCLVNKPYGDYHANRCSATGRMSRCKTCIAEVRREGHRRDPERFREYARRWSRSHPETKRAGVERWQAENPEKRAAHEAVHSALRSGSLVRPETCERCGTEDQPIAGGRRLLQAHHADYLLPLEVEWLCSLCHVAEYRSELEAQAA